MLRVEFRVLPRGHHADVEGRVAEAGGALGCVTVLRRAVQRLDQDSAGRTAERSELRQQRVEQLVRELAHEMAFPVVAVLAVRGVEDALLVEKRVPAHLVVDQTRRRTQLAQGGGIGVRARVARCDDEDRLERRVDRKPRLAAEVARRPAHDVAEAPEPIADAFPAVREQTADDMVERVQAKVEPRCDAEVSTAAAQAPEARRSPRRRRGRPRRPG